MNIFKIIFIGILIPSLPILAMEEVNSSSEDTLAELLSDSAKSGDLETIKLLIALGYPVDQGDFDGKTPLMHATAQGHIHTVQYLLEKGADPNIVDSINGHSALVHAIRSEHPEQLSICKLLILAGADVVNKRGAFTPLGWTFNTYSIPCAQIIIQKLMELPSADQKASWYTFILCMKRKIPLNSYAIRDLFKPYLRALMNFENRTIRKRSLAFQEVMTLWGSYHSPYYDYAYSRKERFKEHLIETFWPNKSSCVVL